MYRQAVGKAQLFQADVCPLGPSLSSMDAFLPRVDFPLAA
jgi:hypothetical protein